MRIRRGGIYAADLNPPHGTELGKIRPVVVVQTNLLNGHHPSTLICPLTTNVRKDVHYLRVHLGNKGTGLKQDSDVLVDQMRAIDNRRLIRAMGGVSPKAAEELNRNIRVLLDLDSPAS